MRFIFPFKFKGFISRDTLDQNVLTRSIRIIPLGRVNHYLGKGSVPTFGNIYNNLLQAMADFDYDYLSTIMEPRLYKACKERLEDFQSKSYRLEYIEQDKESLNATTTTEEEDQEDTNKADQKNGFRVDGKGSRAGPFAFMYEEKDMQLFMEARGAFGVDINRAKNAGKYKRYGGRFNTMEFYKGEKTSWLDIFKKQVLILDVYYYTSRKLVLKDEDGDVLEGSEAPRDCYDHKLRFETYTNKIDWVLCDIDEHLKGNPYSKEQEKAEAEAK